MSTSFEDIKKIISLAKLVFRKKRNLLVNQKPVNIYDVIHEICLKLLDI